MKNIFIREINKKDDQEKIISSSTCIYGIRDNDINISNEKTVVYNPDIIPGNGKIFFINQLIPMMKEYSICFYHISSDAFRREVMNEIIT